MAASFFGGSPQVPGSPGQDLAPGGRRASWHPWALAAARCGGTSLPAELGIAFHSWCLCFLAVGSKARSLPELDGLSAGMVTINSTAARKECAFCKP